MCFDEVNLEQTQIHFACVSQTWWSGFGTLLLKNAALQNIPLSPWWTLSSNLASKWGTWRNNKGSLWLMWQERQSLISSVDAFFPLLASAKKETCETNKCFDLWHTTDKILRPKVEHKSSPRRNLMNCVVITTHRTENKAHRNYFVFIMSYLS